MSNSSPVNQQNVALTAANSSNNAQAGAFSVPLSCNILNVTASAAAGNSLILPGNAANASGFVLNPPQGGQEFTIVANAGLANQVNLFPPVGGTIGNLAVNAPVILPAAGGQISVICDGSLSYGLVSNLGPNSFGSNLVPITGAVTLSPSQSGSIFTVSKAAAYAITLPAANVAANAGLQYTFISGAVAANAVTIGDGGARLNGINIQTAGVTGAQNQATHTFTATSVEGDKMVAICDGARWCSVGTSGVAAGLTCP